MTSIPHGKRAASLFTVSVAAGILAAGATGCRSESPASAQVQRRVGEARLQEGLSLSVTFGAVRAFSETEAVVRQASPTGQLMLESGPGVETSVRVELRNVHLEARLAVSTVQLLSDAEVDGCPIAGGVSIDCAAATESVGQACETSGQCPGGLRCAEGTCQPSDLFDLCSTPDAPRLEGQETSLAFDVDVRPCERIRFETALSETPGPQTVRFAVVGPTRGEELLEDLGGAFEAADVDFIVLLGDNAGSTSESALSALERTSIRLPAPVVAVAGPREIAEDNGEAFLRRFGPHDHTWTVGEIRFFAFYSALGELGPRGFDRLETFLVQLEGDGDAPLIGVTHTPPIDPDGLREAGFRNDLEGLRVLSLLQEHGVDQLYAGSLGAGEISVHDMDLIVTTASGPFIRREREWILVEVHPGADPSLGRVVGEHTVVYERRAIDD